MCKCSARVRNAAGVLHGEPLPVRCDKLPGADGKLVFDRYHIMHCVLNAVDKVSCRR
jgi:hypothetical protein